MVTAAAPLLIMTAAAGLVVVAAAAAALLRAHPMLLLLPGRDDDKKKQPEPVVEWSVPVWKIITGECFQDMDQKFSNRTSPDMHMIVILPDILLLRKVKYRYRISGFSFNKEMCNAESEPAP